MSELESLISDCEKYISKNGIDENIIEAYYNVCQLAKNEGEIDTMLKCTARTKELIEKACMRDIGLSMWEIEKFVFKNKSSFDLIDKYYKRGRVFFIDKIYSNPNCTGYVRISNPKEELVHLHIIEYYDQREEVNKKIESLDNLFNMFNEKYNNYMRNYFNGKSR